MFGQNWNFLLPLINLNFIPQSSKVQSNSKFTDVKFKYTDIFCQNNSTITGLMHKRAFQNPYKNIGKTIPDLVIHNLDSLINEGLFSLFHISFHREVTMLD